MREVHEIASLLLDRSTFADFEAEVKAGLPRGIYCNHRWPGNDCGSAGHKKRRDCTGIFRVTSPAAHYKSEIVRWAAIVEADRGMITRIVREVTADEMVE